MEAGRQFTAVSPRGDGALHPCHFLIAYILTLGYIKGMTEVSQAASLMGRRSAHARAKKWGKAEFKRRMQEWGKLGGRPKGSGKKKGGKQMSIYKRGDVYWYKFMWQGELIRESTKQGNDKQARKMEAAHRTALANGLVGIREKRPAPLLGDFLKYDFQPYVETKHASKPGTVEYYCDGVKMLSKSALVGVRLDEITDQGAQQFAAKLSNLSASRINCGLRTLRRALNLAVEWGKLEKPIKIKLAQGERQRDRVLTDAEMESYLGACPQPWRDCATIIRGTGVRPGEVFEMQWQHVLLNGSGGLIQVAQGKTKAARRLLPMVPEVYAALKSRWEGDGQPAAGWVFPSGSREGHFNKDTAKDQHRKAVEDSGVKEFEPYCLRHTALTRLAESGCDAFTLARIAGHSSITITQRYCHPQAEAVEMAFARLAAGHKNGHNENPGEEKGLQVVGAKGGTRTPMGFPARS
jgi:integrase